MLHCCYLSNGISLAYVLRHHVIKMPLVIYVDLCLVSILNVHLNCCFKMQNFSTFFLPRVVNVLNLSEVYPIVLCLQIYTRDEKRAALKLSSFFTDMFNDLKLIKYVLMLIALILRYTLKGDSFVWVRNVYTVTIVLFYLRILQMFYVERNLGPKVIMIRQMVRTLPRSIYI